MSESNGIHEDAKSAPAAYYHVFLCHRSKGGKDQARLLKSELEKHGRRVYLDVEGLGPGEWHAQLYDAIENSNVLIVVLTFGCLENCESDEDMVRLELEHARGLGKRVIPVLWEGFDWPEDNSQPEIVRWLKGQHGKKHSHDYFTHFIEKLLEWVPL